MDENTTPGAERDELKEQLKVLKKKAAALPMSSGVYLMKDKGGKIIYIGKAKRLRNRVSQYFIFYKSHDSKTRRLVENIEDFEYIIVGNDHEALVLENQLIKLHSPKYNIKLKDGERYPYIRLDPGEEWPRFTVRDARGADRALYFGPYSGRGHIYRFLGEILKIYRLPNCSRVFPRDIGKGRPCLNKQINRCLGICTGEVARETYMELVNTVALILKGDHMSLINNYKEKMLEASDAMDFELAAHYRDRLKDFGKLREKQRILAAADVNVDIFGLYTDELCSCVSVLGVRGGVLVDKEDFHFGASEILDPAGMAQFIQGYYKAREINVTKVLTSIELDTDDNEALVAYLSAAAGAKVSIVSRAREESAHLLRLAKTNAKDAAKTYKQKYEKDLSVLAKLAHLLQLEVLPERIEAYDISNHGADNTVCGMIVVDGGSFKKSDYKRFNIKDIDLPDDYAAMSQAVSRRLARLAEAEIETEGGEKKGFGLPPDLILVDGGKGHVGVVREVVAAAGRAIPVIGMVKDEFHKTRTLTDGASEVNIAKDQAVFTFIYGIQEEAHRFALAGMDKKRVGSVKKSELENIKGLGPAKVKILLTTFKSIEAIKAASVGELAAVKGVTKKDAEAIKKYFGEKG